MSGTASHGRSERRVRLKTNGLVVDPRPQAVTSQVHSDHVFVVGCRRDHVSMRSILSTGVASRAVTKNRPVSPGAESAVGGV